MPAMDTLNTPLAEDEAPALRRGSELPIRDVERVRALADSLECMLPSDLCALAGVKESTLESWAKRGEGPAYVLFGNRRLYPRDGIRQFLKARIRERTGTSRGLL
jgi:hypothetical protein